MQPAGGRSHALKSNADLSHAYIAGNTKNLSPERHLGATSFFALARVKSRWIFEKTITFDVQEGKRPLRTAKLLSRTAIGKGSPWILAGPPCAVVYRNRRDST